MNKKVLIIVGIILLVIIAVVLYLFLGTDMFKKPQANSACPTMALLCPDGSTRTPQGPNCAYDPCPLPVGVEKSCVDSGGHVLMSTCCKSANDFPNTCLIGACGCGPVDSKEVKTCNCPEGSCFNGSACISSEITPVDMTVE